jgi:hypothetical protein
LDIIPRRRLSAPPKLIDAGRIKARQFTASPSQAPFDKTATRLGRERFDLVFIPD